jgi:hypothetical protein
MATKSEIVYNILNLMQGGRISDDFLPSYQQMSFIVDYKRAQYLRQDQTKNYFDNDFYYQDLGCLELVKVDRAECCEIDLGCDILKTKIKLPDPLRFEQRLAIKVNAIDKATRFQIILPERAQFVSSSKYGSFAVRCYWLNGYLYFPFNEELTRINVREVLAKPTDAKQFICGDGPCFTDNSEYPLPADIIDLITKDIINTEAKALLLTEHDTENDATAGTNKG